ncbi:hypothetical protein GCM10029976_046840 [Kribbella albertanoniae]|uniref:PH domain-containing protein n=1 Tax=Kribbella albertanoniae TaxID=1266829 RepID=A0A4R4Q4H6_9ACTN|nr:hypothetical protein [Kribbella albertanoniae]TDC29819.1 hypothetical protein E1261_14900 [Kribbella albertanoniae]
MVMGNQDISSWDAELHRSGRVVFAVRRALAFGGLVVVLPLTGIPIVSVIRDLDTRDTWFTIRVALLAVLLAVAVALAALFLAGHPRVTVNATGIRFAWWRQIPWSEFEGTTLVTPTGGLAAPYLTITSTRGAKLHIPQTNVADFRAFAAWLTKLHTQHQLATSS